MEARDRKGRFAWSWAFRRLGLLHESSSVLHESSSVALAGQEMLPVCSFFVLATSNHPPSVITRALRPYGGAAPSKANRSARLLRSARSIFRTRTLHGLARRRHRQPLKPPTMVLLGRTPPSSARRSWGARTLERQVAGDFVSRGRSAVPAHHVSGIPRCGINGSYRWWSSHRPGPGASQPPCLNNHVWRYWTGPGLHRGETESLADPPHTPSPGQGESRWSTARLSMALQHPRGSFSVR